MYEFVKIPKSGTRLFGRDSSKSFGPAIFRTPDENPKNNLLIIIRFTLNQKQLIKMLIIASILKKKRLFLLPILLTITPPIIDPAPMPAIEEIFMNEL